jgi:PII-like signaling protein
MIPSDATLLSLNLNACHHWKGKPVYRAVVETARTRQIAGASVFLVDLSYGEHRSFRDVNSEYLSFDIPVVVEVIDTPDRIAALTVELGPMLTDGLITEEPVRIIHYSQHGDRLDVSKIEGAGSNSAVENPIAGGNAMSIEGDAQRVTVYIGSSDTWHGHNLAMAIVERCRKLGMAGATASLGVLGFGKHSCIHKAHLFGLSAGLPEKVEIVDRPERIALLLPILEEMVDGGMIIVQDVRAIRYTPHSTAP